MNKAVSRTLLLGVMASPFLVYAVPTLAVTADDVRCDKCVNNSDIAGLSISADKMQNDTVNASKLTDGAVTETKIQNLAVTEGKISNSAVTTYKIKDYAISSIKIKGGAVTSAKIADGTVGAVDINSAEVQKRVTGTCPTNSAVTGVNEDGSVSCSATYPATGFLSVAALAGIPRESTTQTSQKSVLGYVGRYQSLVGTAASDFLIVPVNFPDGATITGITYKVYDNDTTYGSCAYLYSAGKSVVPTVGCSGTTTADSANLITVGSTFSIPVDGQEAYFVYMGINGTAGENLVPIMMTFEYTLP